MLVRACCLPPMYARDPMDVTISTVTCSNALALPLRFA